MGAAFPLSPAPAYYTQVTPGASRGVFYVGGTAPFVTLSKSGATAYTVNDYYGNVVTSGTVSGLTVTPNPPGGGWKPGWYRIYFTGASTDSLFGAAYASSNLVVLRSDARFPTITDPSSGFSGGGSDFVDIPMKGALGIGTTRLSINDATAPTSDITAAQGQVTLSATYWTVSSGNAYFDAARTRRMWVNFPNAGFDSITIGNLDFYCKDGTIDGSTVTVTAVAGTVSGTKLTVNTETYDNLATCGAAATALLASAFVRAYVTGGNIGSSIPTHTAQVIGNSHFNGVKTTVSTLYPSVTRFEGPTNEPVLGPEAAQQMLLFQAAVHAGNASALAIGPASVNIGGVGSAWDSFLAAGGGAYCDEFSTHAYGSQINGDLNLGRAQIGAWIALLVQYGFGSKPIWQTESTQVMSSVYGVYHPRRSRVPLLQTLLLEQYGIPRERNAVWYDVSHGFWAFPTWIEMGDTTLNPHCALYRTLAEETFGQVHSSIMSFGAFGDRIFLGSIYTGASGSTAVIQATSYMPNSTVTLTVTGSTSPLTVVDGFGNNSTVAISAGIAVIPVSDIPTYVRLPAGVTVAVYTCNDWPPGLPASWADGASGYPVSIAGTVTPLALVVDGRWYSGQTLGGAAHGTTMPDTATLTWPTATRLDRVIIWCGYAWQSESTLADFDVQTSVDGATWVTQATVTKANLTSFQFGSDSHGTGCQRETYWDEQYIFDVKLPAPVACKAVRLNVRATSYGGEPDAACVTTGGQGNPSEFITLQEIVTLCDDNVLNPHWGGRTA